MYQYYQSCRKELRTKIETETRAVEVEYEAEKRLRQKGRAIAVTLVKGRDPRKGTRMRP